MFVWKKVTGAIVSLWFLTIALGIASLAVAIYTYRLKFGGDLSTDPAKWSAFGGYIGGIFGPLVSFLTLIAVLRTVYLQRALLKSQMAEFSKMDSHQITAASKQDAQIALAKSEADSAKLQAYVSNQLQLLETLRSHFRREADGMGVAATKILEISGRETKSLAAAEEPLKKKEIAEQKVADLLALSLELSTLDFETIEDVRKAISPKLISITYR